MIYLNRGLTNLNKNFQKVTNTFSNKFNFTDDFSETTATRTGIGSVAYVQSDGKVILGGIDLTTGEKNLRRFLPNGKEDTTFVTDTFGGQDYGYVRDVEVQADGKILVVGHFSNLGNDNVGRICRLNSDGSLDLSYDPSSSNNYGFDGPAFALHVFENNNSLVCGQFSNHNLGHPVNHLLKLDENGQEDTAFTSNWLTNDIDDVIQDVVVQPDEKIILVGTFTRHIHRINSDGSEDTDFTATVGTGFNARCYSIDQQADGKLIVGGWFTQYNGTPCNPGIVRLNADGTLDETFSTEGTGLVNTNDSSLNVQYVYVQRDQKILAGGWFNEYDGQRQGHIIRFNSDGTKDATFQTGDGFGDDSDENGARVQKIVVDRYENIYVSGRFSRFNRATRYDYAKLGMNGELLDFSVPVTTETWGISDGRNDMYDGGNYLNTNLTQLYSTITGDDVVANLSISSTHTQAFITDNNDFEDQDSPYEYSYLPKPNDGKIMPGDAYFGSGSSYFTNMYPGMFVLAATNIHISEFSITGNLGSDGSATDVGIIYPIKSHGGLYSVFFKTNFNGGGDPSVNHLIIIPGPASGITHLYDTTGQYDDHCIQNIDHVRELYYVIVSKGNSDRLSDEEARNLAQKFLDIVVEPTLSCDHNICSNLNQKGFFCAANNCSCQQMKKFKTAYLPAITVCQSYNK